jgi:two-component system nitrate/nitrite sensor histidine kinase NarX
VFQMNCRPFDVSAVEEMQLVRIVQETLTNVRKHAKAQTVRVLLTREGSGEYVLLVEDDGVGFSIPAPRQGSERRSARPGEHIGLSILEERARRIGAQLRMGLRQLARAPGAKRVEIWPALQPADGAA